MDINKMKDIATEEKPVVFDSFEKTKLSKDDFIELDRPISDKIQFREPIESLSNEQNHDLSELGCSEPFIDSIGSKELESLGDEQKQELSELGYSDPVVEAIGSKEEAEIYTGAQLECENVNGKDALIRTDIDLDQKDDFGDTNLERMEKGKPPLDKDGKPIELHHIGQTADAPLAELTKPEHMSNGNDSILHDKSKESEIDRTEFKNEREEHWNARAEAIKQKLGTDNE